MKAPRNLIKELVEHDLLPSGLSTPKHYDQLESLMLEYLCKRSSAHPHVVTFHYWGFVDGSEYSHLIWSYLDAMPTSHAVTSVHCEINWKTQQATCRIEYPEKTLESSWKQETDCVANEFIEFIKTLAIPKGLTCYSFTPQEQGLTMAFIQTKLAKKLEGFKRQSALSRESFLIQDEMRKHRFGHIPILSENLYNEMLEGFRKLYLLESGYLSDANAYKENTSFATYLTGAEDIINVSELLPVMCADALHYLPFRYYNFQEKLCPEEECYYLSLDNPDLKVIFSYQANTFGKNILGDLERDIGESLLLAKDLSWGIYWGKLTNVSESLEAYSRYYRYIILVGDSVIEKAKKYLEYFDKNEKYKKCKIIFSMIEQALIKAGYQHSNAELFVKSSNDRECVIKILRSQKSPGDDIKIQISTRIYLTEASKRYNGPLDITINVHMEFLEHSLYNDDRKLNQTWEVNSNSVPEELAKQLITYLQGSIEWLGRDYSDAEIQDMLCQQHNYFGAAAVALFANERETAISILNRGLVELGSDRDKVTLKERAKLDLGIIIE